MLPVTRLTQQQLVAQVYRLFSYHNSCINNNDTVDLGKKEYKLKATADGSATHIVKNADVTKVKNNFGRLALDGQSTRIVREKPIITWQPHVEVATAHVETNELLHLYQKLTGNKVLLVS